MKIDLGPLSTLADCERASRRIAQAEIAGEIPRSKGRRLNAAIADRIRVLERTGYTTDDGDGHSFDEWNDDERRLFEALVDGDTAAYERIQRERCEKALTALEQGDREPAKTLLTEYAEKHAMIADVA